jgi:hypothetical protein
MFYYWQSQQHSAPGLGGYTTVTITAGSGTQIVSIGFQNDGNATNLWASQIFVYNNGGNAYAQIVNSSGSSTAFWIYIVYATASSAVAADTSDTANAPTIEVTSVNGKA